MTGVGLRPRLVAILAADAVGYSRLMSLDAAATITALETARAIFRDGVAANHGRVIDMAGDSVLAVFEAAAAAITAALAIQDDLARLDADAPSDRQLRFRIGVHLGDVMEKGDGTVYGEGVNVAARLQGLADPGGVTASDAMRSAVKGTPDLRFEDQGLQSMKNIAEPVRAYRVRRERGDGGRTGTAARQTTPSLPDRPSIAVLPFTNMSGEREQEYFADGMVEDIITELSRFQRLFVIARNTSFTYKSQPVDVRTVARELGVHFVLEGSVRRAGDRMRVSAQLIDGGTGRHVWAERYEDVLTDVFALQERITRQVVGSMVPEIEAEEMRLVALGQRRFTEADELAWRAGKAMTDAQFIGKPELADDAIRLASDAIERDRSCRAAWRVMALVHWYRVLMAWSRDRRADVEAAQRAADTLMALAPGDHLSYFTRGIVAQLAQDFAAGTADLRRAHEINPNDALVLFSLSWAEAAAGNVERARTYATQGLRISPKDRWIGVAHLAFAMSAFIERDFTRLRESAELAIQSHPTAPIRRVLMIAYAAEVGDAGVLHEHVARLRSIAPDFIASLFRGESRPFHNTEHMKMLLDSLRRAGVTE